MTPITERLAEAYQKLDAINEIIFAAENAAMACDVVQPTIKMLSDSDIKRIFDLSLHAEYEASRTHPAEGGEGREIQRLRDIEHHCWHILDDSEDEGENIRISKEASKRDLDALYELLPEDHPVTNTMLAESRQADTTTESSAAFLARMDDDAAKWAVEFRRMAISLGYSDMDEGWLFGWFANAIEHSCDVRRRRNAAAQPPQPVAPERGEAKAIAPDNWRLREWAGMFSDQGFVDAADDIVAAADFIDSIGYCEDCGGSGWHTEHGNDGVPCGDSPCDTCNPNGDAEREAQRAAPEHGYEDVAPERGEAKAVTTCRICGKSSPRMTVCDSCDESSGPWGGTAVPRDLPNEPESSIHVEKPEPFTYAVVRKDVSPDFFMSRRAAEDAIAASNNRTAKIVNLYATPQLPQPVAPEERGEAVAWRSRYTMEAGRLSDWHYVDKFVPVASPSTGYEVEALYTAPPPPDRVQPERVEAVPGDDDFVAPPPSEWSKAGQRRLMEALEAAPPTDATDRVEAVECDYCGGSGFINVLDEDGEPVLDFCDAPAHDTPNDASGVTEAAVQALKDSLWSSWGASRQTTDWPNMQQLRAALEAADRARTAPQSPTFRDPTIEDAEKCPRCGRRRTTGAGRLPDWPACCNLVCHCTCHNDPLYCRECKNCDCHKAAPPPQPVAPERGEAKAVAWITDEDAQKIGKIGYVSLLAYADKNHFATNPIYLATPQPQPAPRFRDPTIEDDLRAIADDVDPNHDPLPSNHPLWDPYKQADRLRQIANAIGAKVEDGENAEKCPRCDRMRTTGAGRLPDWPACCNLVCHCTCHNDPLYCRECKDCDCHKLEQK